MSEIFSGSYLKVNRIKSIKHLKKECESDIILNCKGYQT